MRQLLAFICEVSSWHLSVSILTTRILPSYSFATCSNWGLRRRQGAQPRDSAEKSTMRGSVESCAAITK